MRAYTPDFEPNSFGCCSLMLRA